jgi:hypothetical protein
MHKLIEAAGRRSAGVAAGVILTGGLVGGVLLAPAAAYAATTATIAINSATPGFGGITVSVSVTNGSDPLGTFSVAGAGTSGCTGNLSGGMFGMPSNGSGSGRCTIPSVGAGTYSLVASYDGVSSSATSVTVGNPSPPPGGSAPVWSSDSPSTSVDGQTFSYQFQASGSPSFELSGNPSWLNIDPSSGMVSGTIPDGITSFSFSVKAWNNFGSIWAGPFTVFFRHHHHNNFGNANIETSLSCPTTVYTGQHGTCTLWVSNDGSGPASDVTAQITLPWQLRADYCGYYNFFSYGCSISGNTASEDLGTLYPHQGKHLSVTFTALTGFNLFGRHHGHHDTVKVVGSATAGNNFLGWFGGQWYPGQWFGGQRTSYSVAYVTIIPRGFWW